MEYLKMKNRMFMRVFRELWDQKIYENIYYLQADAEDIDNIDYIDYFDLIGIYFEDEEGYQRSLFLPFPLLPKKYQRKIKELIKEGQIKLCSRAWHDILPKMIKPTEFYPNFYYEKISNENDFEDENFEEELQ
jgi:hypothetical protein